MVTKGVKFMPDTEVAELGRLNGVVTDGPAAGRPRLATAQHVCETILALSGTTNGRLAVQGFEDVEKQSGTELAWLAREHEGKRITFPDVQARPVPRHHLARVVGLGARRPPLHRVRDQRRAAQAVAHPHRAGSTSSSTTTG